MAACSILLAAIGCDDDAAHSQRSKDNPNYVYVFDETGVGEAIDVTEDTVGFEFGAPEAEPPLEVKGVEASREPAGGWAATLDYFESQFDLNPDGPVADYSGARLRFTQVRRAVSASPTATEIPSPLSGFRFFRQAAPDHPNGFLYLLAGQDRTYLATVWAEGDGAILSERAIQRLFASLEGDP